MEGWAIGGENVQQDFMFPLTYCVFLCNRGIEALLVRPLFIAKFGGEENVGRLRTTFRELQVPCDRLDRFTSGVLTLDPYDSLHHQIPISIARRISLSSDHARASSTHASDSARNLPGAVWVYDFAGRQALDEGKSLSFSYVHGFLSRTQRKASFVAGFAPGVLRHPFSC
jgi:hypothetical protein